MRLKKYLMLLLLIPIFNGCTWFEPEVITETKVVKERVTLASHPRPIEMHGVKFFVVSKKNFEQFKKDFVKTYGEFTFVAMPMSSYENLGLNMAEVQRYIGQSKNIIIYYENMLSKE